MVKIRLRRVGATKRPMYRIVAADSRAPRDGRFLEILGHYNPLTDPATVVVKEERVQHWIQNGAQPTDVVARLLSHLAALRPKEDQATTVTEASEAAPASPASPGEEAGAPAEEPKRRTTRRRAATQ